MSDSQQWFIDAWALRDGRVFVSRRTAESIESQATVFLSVPDLEPVPVGRISTALRATRSGFQEGFRDAEGQEIAFDSLDQVREIVRRVYLGSGLGGAAPGVPVRAPSPDGGSVGGSYYETTVERPGLDVEWFKHGAGHPAEQLAHLDTVKTEALETLVREFAVATLLEWNGLLGNPEPGDQRSFLAWSGHLARSGVLRTFEDLEDFEMSVTLPPEALLFPSGPRHWWVDGWAAVAEASSALSVEDLLVRTPLPRRSVWDARLTRLSEKRILPLVREGYFEANPNLPELAPVVLIAQVCSAPRPLGRLPGEPGLLQPAIEWLVRELPRVQLPSAATQAVEEFLDAQLNH